jgi:hypothetical protein
MVAPVPAQISKLPPRLPAATRRRPLPTLPTTHYLLPTTPSAPSVLRPQRSLCCAFSRLTPLLPITSLQPQQFHAITHSFAQRRAPIHPIFNGFRALSIATGVYPSRVFDTLGAGSLARPTLLATRTCSLFHVSLPSFSSPRPLFSVVCSLFLQNTRVGVSRTQLSRLRTRRCR